MLVTVNLRTTYTITECHGSLDYKKLSYRREAARCFMSLNTLLSHSRSLKVVENGIIRKLGTVSYWHSVGTMTVSTRHTNVTASQSVSQPPHVA